MGYNNERASLNQFSELYKYCKEHVVDQIKDIYSKQKDSENKYLNTELPFVYEVEKIEDTTPLVSFDGGIATIFNGELIETKLIKVAGAAPPQWKDSFVELKSELFHVLSGLLKWPEGADLDADAIIHYTIDESLKLKSISSFLKNLNIEEENYKKSMFSHLKYKQGKQIEDCFREILEWTLIINFYFDMQDKKNDKAIPFIVIKDGSLYPYGKSVGELFSTEIEKFLNSGKIDLIGVVKSSRFLAEDSSYRKVINKYLHDFKKNTFFQLPKRLEKSMDNKEHFYERYFFSLFNGKTVYEIQIPKVLLQKSKDYEKEMMNILNSQVTFSYGGSIVTNSYAHKEASLSEAEAKILSERLKGDLIKSLSDKK